MVTPPLSPLSDDASPFVPDGEVTLIGLTPEPNSPVHHGNLPIESNKRASFIDSDIVFSSSALRSSSPMIDRVVGTSHIAPHHIVLDVPVMHTSSDPIYNEDVFAHIEVPVCSDVEDLPTQANLTDIYIEDALEDLLVSRKSQSANLVEQERLDPSDSISRVPVPVLDFELPRPDWSNKDWTSREHLSWLQTKLSASCHLPKVSRDARSESSLKWTPVPRGKGIVPVDEELEMDTVSGADFTIENTDFPARSERYFTISQQPAIIDPGEDEEIEERECLQSTSNDAPSQDYEIAPNSEHITREWWQTSSTRDDSLQAICRAVRRKAVDDSSNILPPSEDASATSALLAGFMDLRATKRPRMCPVQVSETTTLESRLAKVPFPTTNHQPPLLLAPGSSLVPAPTPGTSLPKDKGPCIIALTLDRSIVRTLEESWPADMILDRDYSQHDTSASLSGTATSELVVPPFTIEADISLAPSKGVVLTTLLKVKQKALPGSKVQTALRQRVQKLSRKYEALVILISESNSASEFVGSLSSSDMAAYADFVRFTASLEDEVEAFLVPGANKTLARWILSLMCHHSAQSSALARFISAETSTWEVFLRRAGMNVVAAQILSKTLFEQFGSVGLAQFLVMPTHMKCTKYGQLLGGQKVLLRCCEALDRKWT